MKRALLGIILGIFIFGILGLGFVFAEDIICSSNSDCGGVSTSFPFCKNETHICKTTTTPTCNNATTNVSSCEDVRENTCWVCKNGCKNGACIIEDENETEVDNNKTGNGNTVTVNKTRTSRENLTFTPWQKRNESECLEGCSCHGAVMSCETETGKVMTIQAGMSGNIIVITIDGTEVETELEVETETDESNNTKLKAKLSNSNKKEIKIMPDTASERALEKLRLKNCNSENNCTIQLKEVGSNKLAYELQAERHMKVLALFTAKAQVKAQVDAETGKLLWLKNLGGLS